jgi:hypothetical protein
MLASPMIASDQLATWAAGRTGYLARQVGDQESDVKAAGEEAGMQQQVAAVLHRPADGL